jgi:sialate O-acetylesterase
MWGKPRHYKVPAGVVKTGDNVITLRVSDLSGAGGFIGESKDFSLVCNDLNMI